SDTKTRANLISVTVGQLVLAAPTPGTAPGRNTFAATGATTGSEIFLLWSPSQGSSSATLHGCTLFTGLDSPLVLAHARAGSTTVTWRVNMNRRLVGQTIRLQAVDTGVCNASNVVAETF